MKIGYARVSTQEQSLALQLDALRQAGCRQIYEEIVSGARVERPVLQAMLTHLREGDVLMIWKLDRLGRSLRHLIDVVTTLAQRGVVYPITADNSFGLKVSIMASATLAALVRGYSPGAPKTRGCEDSALMPRGHQ